MATLPTPESLGGRPVPEPATGLARYQATSGRETAPGEAIAAGGSRLEGIGEAMRQEQQHIAALQAEDAWNKLRDKELDMTYGAENGYMNVKGADAVNKPLLKDYGDRMQKEVQTLAQGLPSDEARKQFMRRAAVSSINLKDGILRHQAQQANVFAQQMIQGAQTVELASSAANWADPNSLALSRTRYEGIIDAEAARSGLAPDLVKAEKQKFVGAQATMVIQQALNVGNYPYAKMVFEQNKAVVNPNIAKSFQPYDAKVIADQALKSVMTHTVLTGLGAGSPDFKLGLVGDPQVLADQINSALDMSQEDRLAALEQIKRQAAAPGGTAVQLDSKTQIMGKLGEMFAMAAKLTQEKYPGDPIMQDLVTNQLKGYVSNLAAAQAGIAKQAHSTLVGLAIGPDAPTTTDDLLRQPGARAAWDLLDTNDQRGVLGLLDHNMRKARGEFTRSDPALVKDLYERIQLPEGDPRRISSMAQITPYYANGLNPTDGDRIIKEMTAWQTPEGNPFLREKQAVRQSAHAMFTRSMVGQIQPDVAEEAWMRWSQDLERRIEAARKEGKDPRSLWIAPYQGHPNPDYVLAPNVISSFMPTGQAAVAGKAAETIAQTPNEAQRTSSGTVFQPSMYDTKLTPAEETRFAAWKQRYAPQDTGVDYDLRGAFKAGVRPDAKTGHWPDTFKKPNHPTFSDQSQYAKGAPIAPGKWDGDVYIPPPQGVQRYEPGVVYRFKQGDFRYKGGDPRNAGSFEATSK